MSREDVGAPPPRPLEVLFSDATSHAESVKDTCTRGGVGLARVASILDTLAARLTAIGLHAAAEDVIGMRDNADLLADRLSGVKRTIEDLAKRIETLALEGRHRRGATPGGSPWRYDSAPSTKSPWTPGSSPPPSRVRSWCGQ
ncbi:MAG: hypothetical protein ACRDTU_23200 [Micromonosporaceae bacterium]